MIGPCRRPLCTSTRELVKNAHAEPYLDVSGMTSSELASLLAKVVDSWEAWREEAMLWKTAASSRQDITLIRTAVKATKAIPRLPINPGTRPSGNSDLELDLEGRLTLLGSALEELISAGVMSLPVKGEAGKAGEDNVGEIDKNQFELFARINLLQKAIIELGEVTEGGLKEFQLGFRVRLAAIEAIIGSVSALQSCTGQGESSLVGMIEDLEEQVEQLKASDAGQTLIQRVFASSEMMAQNEAVKNAFRSVMQRMITLESTVKELKRTNVGGRAEAPGTNLFDWMGNDMEAETRSVSLPLGTGLDAMKNTVQSLATRVDNLEQTTMPGHRMEGEDITVSFMGVRFSCEDLLSRCVMVGSRYRPGWSQIAIPFSIL